MALVQVNVMKKSLNQQSNSHSLNIEFTLLIKKEIKWHFQ